MSTVCPRTPGPCPRVLILTHGLPALAMTLRFTTSSNGGLFSRNDTPNPGLAPVEQFGIFQVFRQRGSFLTKLCPHQGQGCHGFTLTCAPLARASAKICLAFQRSLPGQPKDARAFPALPPRLPKFCRAVPTLRHLSPKVATTMPAPANPRSPGPRPRLPSLPMTSPEVLPGHANTRPPGLRGPCRHSARDRQAVLALGHPRLFRTQGGPRWNLRRELGEGTESERLGLNLSGSWQQGHSATYNTQSRI